MLTSVPLAVKAASRQVTIRHPNAFNVVVSRKAVLRTELDEDGDENTMGGAPTLGGMGVLRSEDEAEFEYRELGEGKMLFAAPFSPMDTNKQGSALVAENMREVLLESLAKPGEDGYFEATTGDLVMVDLGMGIIMAYTVENVSGNIQIPPYTRRLVLNPRDDLSYVEPFEE